MKDFCIRHPLVTLLIVDVLAGLMSNLYANHVRLQALKTSNK